jgi:hypothetical protein
LNYRADRFELGVIRLNSISDMSMAVASGFFIRLIPFHEILFIFHELRPQ